MAVELRPATAVLVLVAVLAAGSFGSLAVAEVGGTQGDAESTLTVIPLENDDRQLWLYTSRGLSFEQATLPINVVVYGDPEDVHRGLLESDRGNWTDTSEDEQEVAPDENTNVVNPTTIEWEVADGANRFAYLIDLQGGVWLTEHYQVHDGRYLGSRHHIRAYAPSEADSEWTAMQAHHEHWDWFMGRHIVRSTTESQSYVEREFAAGGSPDITRVPVGADSDPSFDQWLTIVDFRADGAQSALAGLAFVLGLAGARRRGLSATLREHVPTRDVRTLLLAAGVAVVLLFVRLGGLSLERSFDVPPKVFAIALYPVLFVGLPLAAYLLARPLDRSRAFAGASVGFIAGVLLDYSYLGVTQLPLDVLVHRGALAVALGLVAVGNSRVERHDSEGPDHLRTGVLLWLVATLLPLLRHTPLPV
ncbi:hypothetical protein [Halobacterium bonnevillei]|uniref:Uncharacterized protein n=1 Tax=Halobacterium bonnevillei TaxID=2692200 RepID=A0A6B0SGT3_9EURY|nr:hypothetical protein [Halobacterium bonnevillei]MXR20207.1 hypothetical protein [Halobacterium bonnevillei]